MLLPEPDSESEPLTDPATGRRVRRTSARSRTGRHSLTAAYPCAVPLTATIAQPTPSSVPPSDTHTVPERVRADPLRPMTTFGPLAGPPKVPCLFCFYAIPHTHYPDGSPPLLPCRACWVGHHGACDPTTWFCCCPVPQCASQ